MIGITTVREAGRDVYEQAQARAAALGLPCDKREGSLSEMAARNIREGYLIYGRKPPYYWSPEGEYRFHLGTASLRIRQLEEGRGDRLCALLPEGDALSVLDCTFGRGNDAAVFSFFLGEKGSVVSLEKSTPLYEVGRAGLLSGIDERPAVQKALRRIRLLNEDFRTFLSQAPEKSYDVLYFDPMFRVPVKREVNRIEGFRQAACYDGIDAEVLEKASAVARKRVILKERPFSKLFRELRFSRIYKHPGQSTAYGVIDV